MAPIVEGPEDGASIREFELCNGSQILADALEIAQVHAEGLEKDALNGEVVADDGYSSLRVFVADVEDGVPGAFLEPDYGLTAGHGEGADIDSPLFQDVGIAFTEVGAEEAVELSDVQFSKIFNGLNG